MTPDQIIAHAAHLTNRLYYSPRAIRGRTTLNRSTKEWRAWREWYDNGLDAISNRIARLAHAV